MITNLKKLFFNFSVCLNYNIISSEKLFQKFIVFYCKKNRNLIENKNPLNAWIFNLILVTFIVRRGLSKIYNGAASAFGNFFYIVNELSQLGSNTVMHSSIFSDQELAPQISQALLEELYLVHHFICDRLEAYLN